MKYKPSHKNSSRIIEAGRVISQNCRQTDQQVAYRVDFKTIKNNQKKTNKSPKMIEERK